MNLKGWIGELKVRFKLRTRLLFGYKILNNILIFFKNGGSTQIDHIVVSRYGIFVIETKNYKGLIVVKPNQKQWHQILGMQRYDFYNPIYQNNGHILALKNITHLTDNYFENIVCFVGKSQFDNPNIAYNNNVVELSSLIGIIKQTSHKVFTKKQVKQIYQQIKNNSLPASRSNNKSHIAYVKNRQNKF